MEGIEQILAKHPFFAGFALEHRRLVAGCARNHRYDAGEYLCREGAGADERPALRGLRGRVVDFANPKALSSRP